MKEKSRMAGGRYIQNQQLEELRNLQEYLTKERHSWNSEKERQEEKAKMENKRLEEEKVKHY